LQLACGRWQALHAPQRHPSPPRICAPQDVKDAFADAGVPVVRADVKTTPEGRSRGFAIVEMPDAASAQRAVEEMDQRELGGRSVNVRRFNVDPPGGRE
jgi:RNA recognition motif-containing protein